MFKLEVSTDGAAFADQATGEGLDRYQARLEILKIVGAAAARIEDGETEGSCRDSNGNTVGSWSLV